MAVTPKIKWGESFANTWTFPGPIDKPEPEFAIVGGLYESGSGLRDRWVTREDHELVFRVRFIPRVVTSGVTGLSDATTGVYHALLWLAQGNIGEFYPDATSGTNDTFYLIEHETGREVPGGSRYFAQMKIRSTTGAAWTVYY